MIQSIPRPEQFVQVRRQSRMAQHLSEFFPLPFRPSQEPRDVASTRDAVSAQRPMRAGQSKRARALRLADESTRASIASRIAATSVDEKTFLSIKNPLVSNQKRPSSDLARADARSAGAS